TSSGHDLLVLSTCRQVYRTGRFERDGSFEPLTASNEWNDASIEPLGGRRFLMSSDRRGVPQLWLFEEGGVPRLVVSTPADHPAVSPDGRSLAWTGIEEGQRGIHVGGIDGSAPRRLTESDTDEHPRFSRDGSAVLF